jgi:hypothetical protein
MLIAVSLLAIVGIAIPTLAGRQTIFFVYTIGQIVVLLYTTRYGNNKRQRINQSA